MRSVAQTLNNVKAHLPRVFSLHSADGCTRAVFSSPHFTAIAETLQSWEPSYKDGWVAIEWRDGEPVQTFGAARLGGVS